MKVRYTFRLRPGRGAQLYLFREFGACRFVWNELVAESRARHELAPSIALAGADPVTFGSAEQDKFLTRLRALTVDRKTGEKWLAAGSSVAQQQTVRDFAAARAKALKDRKDKAIPASRKRGLPRFKTRDIALPTLNYTLRGFSLIEVDATLRLRLPGGVVIPVVWSRALPSAPSSVRVSQDGLGHWYASFVVEQTHAAVPGPRSPDVAIGIDWGVSETATTVRMDLVTGMVDEASTYDLPHAQHGKAAAADLARSQRTMARRRRPRGEAASHGYRLAKFKAARLHKKVAAQRKDDARKWARRIVTDHEQIAVEDFRPKFLAKTTMAKKSADAAIATTKTELIWQAKKAQRDLRLVNPANTTTDCSTCGARTKHRLPLGQRVYTCESCGMVRPRDKNSAAVMVARAGFAPACVEGVSPALDAVPVLAA